MRIDLVIQITKIRLHLPRHFGRQKCRNVPVDQRGELHAAHGHVLQRRQQSVCLNDVIISQIGDRQGKFGFKS